MTNVCQTERCCSPSGSERSNTVGWRWDFKKEETFGKSSKENLVRMKKPSEQKNIQKAKKYWTREWIQNLPATSFEDWEELESKIWAKGVTGKERLIYKSGDLVGTNRGNDVGVGGKVRRNWEGSDNIIYQRKFLPLSLSPSCKDTWTIYIWLLFRLSNRMKLATGGTIVCIGLVEAANIHCVAAHMPPSPSHQVTSAATAFWHKGNTRV